MMREMSMKKLRPSLVPIKKFLLNLVPFWLTMMKPVWSQSRA